MSEKKNHAPAWLIETLALTALTAAAFGVRYALLSLNYLDIDEAFQFFIISRPTLKELFPAIYSLGPQQYPLDYVIGFAVARLTVSLEQLRWLPLLWGVATVPLVYQCGKIIWDRMFGVVWAWLLVVSFFHVRYSQMLRPYSLIVFLSVLSLYFFLRSMRSGKQQGLFAACAIFYQLAYPFAFFSTAVECVYGCVRQPEHRKKYGAIIFLSGLIPVALVLLHLNQLVAGDSFYYTFSAATLKDVFVSSFQALSQYTMLSVACYAGLVAIGVYAGLSQRPSRDWTGLALVMSAVIMVSIIAAVWFTRLFFHPRHMIPILPLYLGLVAAGVVALAQVVRKALPRAGGLFSRLVVLVICGGVSTLFFDPLRISLYVQSNMRNTQIGTAAVLNVNLAPGDTVIFGNPNTGATVLYYLDRQAFLQLPDVYLVNGFNLFRFPKELKVDHGQGSYALYTLCSMDPAAASISKAEFEQLRAAHKKQGEKIWLIDLPDNYIAEPNPFITAFDLKPEELELKYPGIYSLKM